MMRNKFSYLFLLFCGMGLNGSGELYGQATASPVSYFGIGEISSGNHGENSGMGGIGIGFRQANTLNNTNPAAISALLPQTFVFDGSFFGKMAFYGGRKEREYAGSGNVSRIGIGFRAAKGWAISLGMVPFSSVGYDIRKSSPVEGSFYSSETSFSGSGGLSKIYLSQAFNLSQKLALGVNASVIFGSVTHSETSPYWTSEHKSRGDKIYFDFGLQYTENWDQKTLTVGLVGGYREKISMYNTSYTYTYEGSLATNDVLPSTRQYIPEFYGAGVSLSGRRLTVGLDYLFQKWSEIKSTGTVRYKDMNKLSGGVSYLPNMYSVRNYWQRVKYQAGFVLNDSYLEVSRRSKINYALTAGAVFPMRNTNSVNCAIEYGRNRIPTGSQSMIREDYFKVTVGFSFKDAWFLRYKYD